MIKTCGKHLCLDGRNCIIKGNMMANGFIKLKSGTDVRGVASPILGRTVTLTEEATETIARAFATWLQKKTGKTRLKIALGNDSRITAKQLVEAFERGATKSGADVVYTGLSSTPSMFMILQDEKRALDGSVMVTASHLPADRNGLKFFAPEGGLEGEDVDEILAIAQSGNFAEGPGRVFEDYFMDEYSEILVARVRKACGTERPLEGKKVIVDAGNGAGGFFTEKVLKPLGADTTGSLYLEPDGTFPHHAPNPEDKVAIDTLKKQVLACHADLGIIFDTDVDRAGAVDVKGEEINRNRLIALISAQLLEKRPGTIVTDSVTSDGLTKFIEERGGRHHRYMRGYRNVIDECKRLNDAGEYSPLAVETSGHCAFKDNYFLDDGAYLVTEILIILAGQLKKGKRLADLISGLEEPAEATEIRLPIDCDEFREYGKIVLKNFESAVKGCGGADIAPDNYEGVRVNFDKEHGDGWALVRMSLHEAIIPINIESGSLGGCKKMAKTLLSLLEENKKLDFTPLLNYIKS